MKKEVLKDLMTLPNIGKTMAERLVKCGVKSKKDFLDKDPRDLWLKMKRQSKTTKICETHFKVILGAQMGVPFNQIREI